MSAPLQVKFCRLWKSKLCTHLKCSLFSQSRHGKVKHFVENVQITFRQLYTLHNRSYSKKTCNIAHPFWTASGLTDVNKQLSNVMHCSTDNVMPDRGPESHRRLVLGIETSCDDTGAAVVDAEGNILGEALNNQTRIHVETGGIIPPVARDLHKQNIHDVVTTALRNAGVTVQDVDAIATTVKPGMVLSLRIGLDYTKQLLRSSGKPFIPIHHMHAHALTARMMHKIDFPFLVLLISGGHCLLVLARNVDDFIILGKGVDIAPGDAFDKVARELRLKNLPECDGLSGGRSIELMAERGDPRAFPLKSVMSRQPNCNFSFSGINTYAKEIITREVKKHETGVIDVVPSAPDICASFQYFVLHHLAKRLQRALLFCDMKQLLPPTNKTLVVSGGVASNMFLRRGLQRMCDRYDTQVICPPPKLCTDNGIMIAWNGMEKLKLGIGVEPDFESVTEEARSPMGEDWTEMVEECHLKLDTVKLID